MPEKIEIIMDKKNMEEALEILAFLQGLNPRDRNDFQQFLEGVKYGLN